jgi:hypothetical protein
MLGLVTLALLATGCTDEPSSDRSASEARHETAPGSAIPAPPVALDEYPTQFGVGDAHYVVVDRDETSGVWRDVAAWSFGAKQWRRLPQAPDLQASAWSSDGAGGLVVVGLRGCDPDEGVRCSSGIPVAHWIDLDDGGWKTVDLDVGRVEVPIEHGWYAEGLGGKAGTAYFLTEEGTLAVSRRQARFGASPALDVSAGCVIDDELVVTSYVRDGSANALPAAPDSVPIHRLPLDFSRGQGWRRDPPSPPLEGRFAGRPLCDHGRLMLVDLANGRVALPPPDPGGAWRATELEGDGAPRSPVSTNVTASGDVVAYDQAVAGHRACRLRFDADWSATWRCLRLDSDVLSVVGDEVYAHDRTRWSPAEMRWDLRRLDL